MRVIKSNDTLTRDARNVLMQLTLLERKCPNCKNYTLRFFLLKGKHLFLMEYFEEKISMDSRDVVGMMHCTPGKVNNYMCINHWTNFKPVFKQVPLFLSQ